MKILAVVTALLLAPLAAAGSRATLQVTNGSTPFHGDRLDLTTVSPNGDGRRDAASISFDAPEAGTAHLVIDRADHKGQVLIRDVTFSAGKVRLSWAPPSFEAPGTYVVHLRPSTGVPLSAVVRVQTVDAAAGASSYSPGDVARIAVSTDATALQVSVIRIDQRSIATTDNHSVVGTVVKRSRPVAWRHPDAPHNVEVPIGDWESGVYFARVTAADGRVGYAPFVVRPRRAGSHRIAIVMPTNTWQAYNFYDRNGDGRGDTWYAGWRVHEMRLGRPYLYGGVPAHFRYYDLPFLAWTAEHRLHADYLSDADLDRIGSGARLARLYDLIVFPGHHEYVTQREYDAVRTFRDRGGNLIWLSANNFFWKVVRHGPMLERVAQWRTLGRPEAGLIGVQYRGNDEGQRLAPMQPVPAAAPWLFTGTPMEHGEPWGRFGIEIDHTSGASPKGTTVVASVPDLYGPGFTAQMTYYETPAGAKVFAAGAFSLAHDALSPTGDKLLENLFDRMEAP